MKFSLTLLLLCFLSANAMAAEKESVFTDPDAAGADWKIQGEYVGQAGNIKLGAQVVAQGKGAFKAVFLTGGLPGEGWDTTSRAVIDGKRDGDKIIFPVGGDGYTAAIAGDRLTGHLGEGAGMDFELKKLTRTSPTAGAKPPEGATVLFDGTNTDQWQQAKMDDRKLLSISGTPGGKGILTKQAFGDFTLHVEFIIPFKPEAHGQERGNSGVYIQRRYEIQVLDSFGDTALKNGCASVYTQVAPSINMSYPPLTWQTYDIDFTAARFEEGKKVKDAFVTVKHNGVVVQDKTDIKTKTGAGQPEGPDPMPLLLQDHGNPVFYRNVWVVAK